jgi:hypothetical protein
MKAETTLELIVKGQPIGKGGELQIPPEQNPVYLQGADIKHYTKMGHRPMGSPEFFERLEAANSSLGDRFFPVTLAISDKKIIFHSHYRPKVFGDGYTKSVGGVCYGWLSTKDAGLHIGVEAIRQSMTPEGMFRMDVCSRSDLADIQYRIIFNQDMTQYANDIISRCGGQEFFDNGTVERVIAW